MVQALLSLSKTIPWSSVPVFSTPNTASVAENTTAVLTVNATDADKPDQTVTYSLTGGDDQGAFTIDSNSGVLAFATAPDYEAFADNDNDNVDYDLKSITSDLFPPVDGPIVFTSYHNYKWYFNQWE